MTKDEMILNLMSMANQLVKDYSYDLNKRMWRTCLDWNDEHPDEEIFMCETDDGFAIEDDVWILPEH